MDQGSLAHIASLRPSFTDDGRMDLLFYGKLEETSDMLVRVSSGRSARKLPDHTNMAARAQNPTQEPARQEKNPVPTPSSSQFNQEKGNMLCSYLSQ